MRHQECRMVCHQPFLMDKSTMMEGVSKMQNFGTLS